MLAVAGRWVPASRTVASLPRSLEGGLPPADRMGLTRLQAAFREHHALQCGFSARRDCWYLPAIFLARNKSPESRSDPWRISTVIFLPLYGLRQHHRSHRISGMSAAQGEHLDKGRRRREDAPLLSGTAQYPGPT